MKHFEWNEEKNQLLRSERNISFEQIVEAINRGGLLDRVEHPNRDHYSHQEILVVEIDGYAYLVPFVSDGDKLFLKTIYKSRKATRDYLKKED